VNKKEIDEMNERINAKLEALRPKKKVKEIPSSKMIKVKTQNKHARFPSPELAVYMAEHQYKDKK
jgi:hypothetical protein